jgi:hypothetical protein
MSEEFEQVGRPLTAAETAYHRASGTFDGVNLARYEPMVVGEVNGSGGQLVYRLRTTAPSFTPMVTETRP